MREQILLCYMLGIKQMVVAVNKMDADDVLYDENRFNQIKSEVSHYLKKVGYQLDHVAFVPISAWENDNLVTISNNMPWFKDALPDNIVCFNVGKIRAKELRRGFICSDTKKRSG
ncbi:unnamed protein product [Rotaria socialis]|uniref:Tr-type G domain-containing protein n=1 Tax=Rotaria socialis TaxID=392032 RepID=A0A821FI77_9BILA|nr:unnamed protein product [Rotaria socialis]CAF4651317.1 unnamed protein product [Rotaria socialis]